MNNIGGICTDGTPAMTGKNIGLRGLIQNNYPNVKHFNCTIHKFVLVIKP